MSENLDKVEEEIGDIELNRKWINHQLYQALSCNLKGKALNMIRNVDDKNETEGIVAWCKIAQEHSAMTAQKMQSLMEKVTQPKRCKRYDEVTSSIEAWELDLKLVEKNAGMIPEQLKVQCLKNIVPDELSKDIAKVHCGKTYEEVKRYIVEQVGMRKEVKNAAKGPASTS